MADKKLDRREFLKLTFATAAATGLSHFQFLNFGGLDIVYAQCDPAGNPDVCDPTQGEPDVCEPVILDPDVCEPPYDDPDECGTKPGDDDLCTPDPLNPDLCPEPAGGPEQDFCDPIFDPDACDPFDNPPDEPTAVTLTNFSAKSPAMSAFGGVVAVLAGAALWVRRRMFSESDED
jgi:hypothetical protein